MRELKFLIPFDNFHFSHKHLLLIESCKISSPLFNQPRARSSSPILLQLCHTDQVWKAERYKSRVKSRNTAPLSPSSSHCWRNDDAKDSWPPSGQHSRFTFPRDNNRPTRKDRYAPNEYCFLIFPPAGRRDAAIDQSFSDNEIRIFEKGLINRDCFSKVCRGNIPICFCNLNKLQLWLRSNVYSHVMLKVLQ